MDTGGAARSLPTPPPPLSELDRRTRPNAERRLEEVRHQAAEEVHQQRGPADHEARGEEGRLRASGRQGGGSFWRELSLLGAAPSQETGPNRYVDVYMHIYIYIYMYLYMCFLDYSLNSLDHLKNERL